MEMKEMPQEEAPGKAIIAIVHKAMGGQPEMEEEGEGQGECTCPECGCKLVLKKAE